MADDEQSPPKKKTSRLKRMLGFARGLGGGGNESDDGDWEDSSLNADMSFDELLETEEGRFSGDVHIVSLVELKASVGDGWAERADRILLLADGVIRHHIASAGFSMSYGETFALVFPDLDDAEAKRRAAAIADELGTRLLGEGFEGACIRLGSADASELMGEDGALDVEALDAAVDDAVSLPPPTRGPSTGGGGRKVGAPRLVARSSGRPKGATGGWKPMARRNEAGPTRSHAITPPGRDGGSGRSQDAAPPSFTLSYFPTWRAAGEAVDVFVAAPESKGAVPEAARIAYDAQVVRRAAGTLGDPPTVMMVAPIHFASASEAGVAAIGVALGDAFRDRARAGLLLEVMDIPADVGVPMLEAAFARLGPFAKGVFARDDLRGRRVQALAAAGASAVGIDLAGGGYGADLPDRLAAFAEKVAAPGRVASYVWGLRRRHDAADAIVSGFAMINGVALKSAEARPAGRLALPRERLMKVLESGRRQGG